MRSFTLHATLMGLLFATACGGGIAVDRQATFYLQYNLHADRTAASSINYWSNSTLLPVCTPVNLVQAKKRRITFTANGQRYTYTLHRSTRVNLATHLQRTFAASCPNFGAMSPIDQRGIQSAMPMVGMSKQGVLYAVGYPPDHRTAQLTQNVWTYWGVQGQVTVNFNGDTVMSVQGRPSEPAVIAAAGQVPPPVGGVTSVATAPGVTTTQTTGTAPPAIEIAEHDDSQAVQVSGEATVGVVDPQGRQVQIPQSALGATCGPERSCHEALVCVSGSCQPSQ